MKKLIVALSLLISFCCAACGENQVFDPWDKLGGGGEIAVDGKTDPTSIESYSPNGIVSVTDEQMQTDFQNAIIIDLSNTENLPLGVTLSGTTLTVSEGGVYELTGDFKGNIVVKDCDGASVRLVLGGVILQTPENFNGATILFEKTDGFRAITSKMNTVNAVSDSPANVEDGAAIRAKKCSLTINGVGELQIVGNADKSAGIKVKKTLTLVGVNVVIDAKKNGISADEKIQIGDSFLKIKAGGDGIKTDVEPETKEEAETLASDREAGYIYIENTSIEIEAGDDGIAANSGLYFANTEDNLVKIITNGGAPSIITETSSDNAEGKALKTGGISYETENGEEVDVPASYEANYSLVITGGRYELNSNSDAISSKGNLFVSDGKITLSSGDDGVHAEYLTKITGGEIEIARSYEGIEGAAVEIYGGKISLISSDDGINAANGDLSSYDYHIYVGGGELLVNAQGDGVDSNGWMIMAGGTLVIYGPTRGGNGALDTDKGFLLKGGTLLAVGASGMVETPSSSSKQYYISVNVPSGQIGGTEISITQNGKTLLENIPPKSYQSVIISLPAFEKGKTYTVTVGDEVYTATLEKIGTALGSNAHGGMNQGGRPGWKPFR